MDDAIYSENSALQFAYILQKMRYYLWTCKEQFITSLYKIILDFFSLNNYLQMPFKTSPSP
jgi:hypothetical protein